MKLIQLIILGIFLVAGTARSEEYCTPKRLELLSAKDDLTKRLAEKHYKEEEKQILKETQSVQRLKSDIAAFEEDLNLLAAGKPTKSGATTTDEIDGMIETSKFHLPRSEFTLKKHRDTLAKDQCYQLIRSSNSNTNSTSSTDGSAPESVSSAN